MAQKDDGTIVENIDEKLSSKAGKAADEVKKGAEEIRAAAGAAADDFSDDLRQLREDIARLSEVVSTIASSRGGAAAAAVAEGLTDSVRAVKDNVFATAAGACNAGADIAGSACEHAASFAGDVEDTVRRNPLGAVLTSLGIGILIGMISRSR